MSTQEDKGPVSESVVSVKEKKPIYKRLWFLLLTGFVILVIIVPKKSTDSQGGESVTKDTLQSTESKKEVSQSSGVKDSDYLDRVGKEIESIKKGIDFSGYKDEISSLQIELSLFKLWGKMVEEGVNSSNQKEVQSGKKLQSMVSKVQMKEFPRLRKEYGRISRSKLWENNIEVSVSGNGTSIITFTSGIFLSNKNISESYSKLSEILSMFRFKKCQFKGYDSQEGFSYYTLETPKDSEVLK